MKTQQQLIDDLKQFCHDNALPHFCAEELDAELQGGGRLQYHRDAATCREWLHHFMVNWNDMLLSEKELEHHICLEDPDKPYSWWAKDARGIELCRVCEKCEEFKMRRYRPEVLIDSQYQADDLGDDMPL